MNDNIVERKKRKNKKEKPMPEEIQTTSIAGNATASMLTEDELNASFDQQASKAWDKYEMLSELAGSAQNSTTSKSTLDPEAMSKLKRFWDENKDNLIS